MLMVSNKGLYVLHSKEKKAFKGSSAGDAHAFMLDGLIILVCIK